LKPAEWDCRILRDKPRVDVIQPARDARAVKADVWTPNALGLERDLAEMLPESVLVACALQVAALALAIYTHHLAHEPHWHPHSLAVCPLLDCDRDTLAPQREVEGIVGVFSVAHVSSSLRGSK
jgi:hypothetical protein